MSFRGFPWNGKGKGATQAGAPRQQTPPTPWFLALAVTTVVCACSNQEPAFTESRSAKERLAEGDSTVRARGAAGEPLSEDALAKAKETNGGVEGESGTAGTDANGADGASGSGGAASDSGAMDAGGEELGDVGATGGGSGDGAGSVEGGATGDDGMASGSGTGAGSGSDGGSAGGTGEGGATGEGGVNGSLRTVNVTQGAPGKVDILWIVDTSGSMSEEQQYLGQNFNALISALQNSGNDFQTAVTTTDVCQDQLPDSLEERRCPLEYGGSTGTHLRGSFVGENGAKVLKQGQADLVQKFNEYTAQGVNGSGFEHGLKAAQLAIEKVLNGQNEALIRDGAFLAVIVVSDEQDDGIGMSQVDAYNGHNFYEEGLTRFRFTEDDFINYVKGVKGEGKFSVSAITPTRLANGSLCSAPHTAPLEEGAQYIAAATKSGGIVQSICETNWNASLANIGVDLSAQITQIALPSAPDAPTIRVYVNNVETTQWTYASGNNAVKFNAGHVPAQGAAIKVTYYEKP